MREVGSAGVNRSLTPVMGVRGALAQGFTEVSVES